MYIVILPVVLEFVGSFARKQGARASILFSAYSSVCMLPTRGVCLFSRKQLSSVVIDLCDRRVVAVDRCGW